MRRRALRYADQYDPGAVPIFSIDTGQFVDACIGTYAYDLLHTRMGTLALPCYHPVIKRAKRLKSPCYPNVIKTIGDHIRKRRLDLRLFQKDIAKKLQTTTDTITNWEKNRCEPELRYYPAIMHFLGYCPIQYTKTWGERLNLYRIHQGFSIKELAQLMGVDPGALSKQMTKKEPSKYFRERFENFWESC